MKKKFPIKKFVLMMSLLSCFTFNTKILKILKDTLVVSNPNLGAHLIPFLKTWALLPFTVLMIFFYNWLSTRYSPSRVFQILTGIFVTFFIVFYLFLWPYEPIRTKNGILDYIYHILPNGLSSIGLMLEHWPIALFYVMADTWSTIFISLIFWNVISQILTSDSAKEIYPWFSLDISSIIIGLITLILIWIESQSISYSAYFWEFKFSIYISLLVIVCLLQVFLFFLLVKKIELPNLPSKTNDNYSFYEKFSLIRSPFFIGIAVIVFLMEFTDALFDTLWKDVLNKAYPDPNDFSNYLSLITAINGILVILTVFFISRKLLRRYSWTRIAILPPILLLLTSSFFFTCLFCRDFAFHIAQFFSVRIEAVIAFSGAIQACVMQLAKTTFFDNTRELAFLSCSLHERRLGKSFSDAFASRMGKSTASITQQSLLFTFILLSSSYSYIAMMIIISIPIWMYSTYRIGTYIKDYNSQK